MKKLVSKICILILIICSNSLLAKPTLQDSTVFYPKAQYSPVIDGTMDLIWHNAPRFPIAGIDVDIGEFDSWYDLSGEWRAMWDNDYLYYLIEIRDDILNIGEDWKWDSIELYSDGDYSHGLDYDGIDDVQLRFNFGDETRAINAYTHKKGPEFDFSNSLWEEELTEYGYRIEISMAFVDLLIFDLEPGKEMGVDVVYNDNDEGIGRDHKIITFSDEDESWRNPSYMGKAILSDWLASDTLMVVKTGTKPTIDGELDAVWKEVPIIAVSSYSSLDMVEDYFDLSMNFRTMWDANYLYYFVTVWDEDLSRDGSGDEDDDGIDIYSDGDYSHGQNYDGKDDYQFAFRYVDSEQVIENVQLAGNSATTPADLSGVLQAAKKFDEGLTLEAAFPIQSLLGIKPEPGSIYGVEVCYNDDDAGGTNDTKLNTYSGTDIGQDPSAMATAKLVGDITVSVNSGTMGQFPDKFVLGQNYPNPFNPWTTIKYHLPKSGLASLKIYNLAGQLIETLVNGFQSAGVHEIQWTAEGLPSGIYIYRLEMGDPFTSSGHRFSETKKLVFQQ